MCVLQEVSFNIQLDRKCLHDLPSVSQSNDQGSVLHVASRQSSAHHLPLNSLVITLCLPELGDEEFWFLEVLAVFLVHNLSLHSFPQRRLFLCDSPLSVCQHIDLLRRQLVWDRVLLHVLGLIKIIAFKDS